MLAAFDEAWGIILLKEDIAPENEDAARERLAKIIVDQAEIQANNLHGLAHTAIAASISGDRSNKNGP
jgi:hypothetical protein